MIFDQVTHYLEAKKSLLDLRQGTSGRPLSGFSGTTCRVLQSNFLTLYQLLFRASLIIRFDL